MNQTTNDAERGLYQKFNVTRTDGSSGPGGKHEHCQYFVLDATHDPHAKAALVAYAASCERDYPTLADDVRRLAEHGHRRLDEPADDADPHANGDFSKMCSNPYCKCQQ